MEETEVEEQARLRDLVKGRITGIDAVLEKRYWFSQIQGNLTSNFGKRLVVIAKSFIGVYYNLIHDERIGLGYHDPHNKPSHDEFRDLEAQLRFAISKSPSDPIWEGESIGLVENLILMIQRIIQSVEEDLVSQKRYEQQVAKLTSGAAPRDLLNRALYGNSRHNSRPGNPFFKKYNN